MDTKKTTVVIDSLDEEIRSIEEELEEVKRSAARLPLLQAELEHLRATRDRYTKRLAQENSFHLTSPTNREPVDPPATVEEAVLTAEVLPPSHSNSMRSKRSRGPKVGSIGYTIINVLKEQQQPMYITDIHAKLGTDKIKYESLSGTLAYYARRGWLVRPPTLGEGYYAIP